MVQFLAVVVGQGHLIKLISGPCRGQAGGVLAGLHPYWRPGAAARFCVTGAVRDFGLDLREGGLCWEEVEAEALGMGAHCSS